MKSRNTLLAVVALTSVSASAAPGKYWIAGDGDWSNTSNWQSGAKPVAGDETVFREGIEARVNVDEAVKTGFWTLVGRGEGQPVTTVEWYGTGSITNDAQSVSKIWGGRRLVINGPDVYVRRNLDVTNSELVVKSGQLASGNIDNYAIRLYDGATMMLEGGRVETYGVTRSGSAAFVFKGGTMCWRQTLYQPSDVFLPPAGASLEITQTKNVASIQFTKGGGVSTFSGTIAVTNGTASSHHSIEFYKCNYTLNGGGTIIADQLGMNNGYIATLRLKRLILGSGYGVNSTQSVFYFPDGIEFGAYGNWNDGSVIPVVRLAGPVKFNTLDYVDGATTRSIQMKNCVDYGMTSLEVVGGGTVDLKFAAGINALEKLEIAAGTTLALTNTASSVSVRKLKMGAGARLLLTAGKCSVEVVEEPELDPAAEIVFAVPSTLATGALHPVWISVYGGDMPSNVSLPGLGDTSFTRQSVRGCHYLTDGTVPAADTSKYEWVSTGVSTNWTTTANWSINNGAYPYGSTYAYFGAAGVPFTKVDMATDSRNYIRQVYFNAGAGPHFIYGEKLRVTYGASTSASVIDSSKFPSVFENYVRFTNPAAYLSNLGSSYLAFLGGGSNDGMVYVRGDVRFGGVWSAGTLNFVSPSDAQLAGGSRKSRLTVLDGCTLTLTNATVGLSAPANISIYGTFDVSNTLSSVSTARWRGNGVVKLHGVDTSAAASFRLGDSLTLYPMDGWTTVAAATPEAAVTISARETPTLGATSDWTYGPEAGAEPTTGEADRALTVADGATLTINTEDPDSGIGHVVTFEDPIRGGGSVVKAGAGTLVFATTNTVLGGSFSVAGGGIDLAGAVREAAMGRKWMRLVTAASVEGLAEALPSDFVGQVVGTGDGSVAFEVRRAPAGLMIIVN